MEAGVVTRDQRGFTLLELILVLILISISIAMVAPNIFRSPEGELDLEAQYLSKQLALIAEEAVLTGKTFRWRVVERECSLQEANLSGEWIKSDIAIVSTCTLPSSVSFLRIGALDPHFLPEQEDGILGQLLFFPDGMLTPSEVVLQGEEKQQRTIVIKAGPGGIKVKSE